MKGPCIKKNEREKEGNDITAYDIFFSVMTFWHLRTQVKQIRDKDLKVVTVCLFVFLSLFTSNWLCILSFVLRSLCSVNIAYALSLCSLNSRIAWHNCSLAFDWLTCHDISHEGWLIAWYIFQPHFHFHDLMWPFWLRMVSWLTHVPTWLPLSWSDVTYLIKNGQLVDTRPNLAFSFMIWRDLSH